MFARHAVCRSRKQIFNAFRIPLSASAIHIPHTACLVNAALNIVRKVGEKWNADLHGEYEDVRDKI